MNSSVAQSVMAKKNGHLNTPCRDLPPSLGFGSSSSPGIDSSPSLQRSYNWRPSLAPTHSNQFAKSTAPNKIPSLVLFGDSKANDDTMNDSSFEFSRGLQDSLNELTDDVVANARLLPADFPHPASEEITIENLESSPPISTRTLRSYFGKKPAGNSPRPSMGSLAGKPVESFTENLAAQTETEKVSTSDDERTISVPESNDDDLVDVSQRKRSRADSAVSNFPYNELTSESTSLEVSLAKRRKSSTELPVYMEPDSVVNDKIPVYSDAKTETGLPLVSGEAFKKICNLQSFRTKDALRTLSLEYSGCEQRHYVTKNSRLFDFGINTSGAACVNLNKPVDTKYYGSLPTREQDPLHIIDTLDEDSDSESDDECEPREEILPSLLRSPPRFSTLGNYDAVTEFARTLGRSHHNGFMFSFPNDHESSDINESMEPHLATPQTPKMTEKFNKSLFNSQMRTPPGAIFSYYDYQMGNFATGMTPFINRLQ